jgi:hypothetical protein
MIVFLCGAGLLFVGCEQKQQAGAPSKTATTRVIPSDARNAKINAVVHPVPSFMDRALLGSEVGPDGVVSKVTSTFQKGQQIHLTLMLRESPPGLQTRAVWYDAGNKELQSERREMNGGKLATFTLNKPTLKPGRYHVIGYWGGNVAAQKDFEIAAPAKRGKG